jgi:RNA polymerase sigma-70 factor (ECF subfamily)
LATHPDDISVLISRVALRDRAAFLRLYDLTSAKLFGSCLRILKDRLDAEDAVQDVYVKVWNRAGNYRPLEANPMAWLITIARNHALDRLRARANVHADLDAAGELADPAPGPEASAIAGDELARIVKCLGELDPKRAEAVQAAYVEGFSYSELAHRFGVPLNTIRTWLHRSLRSLRDCLERT